MTGASSGATHAPWGLADAQAQSPRWVGIADNAYGQLPLALDGRAEEIYHPFDRSDNRRMEYLTMRGEFDDVPLEDTIKTFASHYGHMSRLEESSFDDDVRDEVAAARRMPLHNLDETRHG